MLSSPGCVAVLAIGYAHRPALNEKPDATTPVAAVATVGLGFLAGFGEPALAIAGATIVTLLLALKAELHGLLDKLDDGDVKALARYAVIAGAVLPFLPNGHYGPLRAWNLQKLWLVVVLVTGFSFLGYVANRIFGERHGTIATALIGGAYSSTAVTQSLAQRLGSEKQARAETCRHRACYRGHVFARAGPDRCLRDARPASVRVLLLPAVVVAWGAGLLALPEGAEAASARRRPVTRSRFCRRSASSSSSPSRRSLHDGRRAASASGLAVLLLIIGSMDVDIAIVTLGGLPPAAISPLVAAMAIAGTIIVNMAVKIGITLAYARRLGFSAAAAMAASVVALAVMIGLAWTQL